MATLAEDLPLKSFRGKRWDQIHVIEIEFLALISSQHRGSKRIRMEALSSFGILEICVW